MLLSNLPSNIKWRSVSVVVWCIYMSSDTCDLFLSNQQRIRFQKWHTHPIRLHFVHHTHHKPLTSLCPDKSAACTNSSWSFWWLILTFIICTAAVLFYNLLTLESNHNVINYCNVLKCKVLKFLGVIQCKKIGLLLMLWNVFPDFHAVEVLNPIRSPHDLYTWILITICKSKKLRCHFKYEDCGVTVCQLRQKNRNNVLYKYFRSDQDELLHQWVMCYHHYFIAVNKFLCLIRFGPNFWCNSLAGADQSVHYKEYYT